MRFMSLYQSSIISGLCLCNVRYVEYTVLLLWPRPLPYQGHVY